ncbi:hypothetical protein [Spirosoma spitsbergense]|uniref:hypothetical protein n=1 Tax=Spirosoma spitsbergense TaxID=431554 RepID=UPI00039B4EDD|nr:hypothetical protein [Spirosoma spitsbergense]
MRFVHPSVLTAFFWLLSQLVASGQSSLDSLLTTLVTNNPYLRAGRSWVDSCQGVSRLPDSGTALGSLCPSTASKPICQSRQEMAISYQALHLKIYRQARLTGLELIYQRKRLGEFINRQQLIHQFSEALLWRNLTTLTNLGESEVSTLFLALTEKRSQKEIAICRLQEELDKLNGGQPISVPDTIYPILPPANVLFGGSNVSSFIYPTYEEWRDRYILLKRVLNLYTDYLKTRPSLGSMIWEVRMGQLTPKGFIAHFGNVNELIDSRMRTERDLHIAATYLLGYVRKPSQLLPVSIGGKQKRLTANPLINKR